MNILFTEMEHHNLQWQIKLVEDGHTVYTNQFKSKQYLKSLNINSISEITYEIYVNMKELDAFKITNEMPEHFVDTLEQVIEKYKIDLIINTWPGFNSIIPVSYTHLTLPTNREV